MSDTALEITFPGSASAVAGEYAHELGNQLARGGVAAEGISTRRADSEAMDIGSVLMLTVEAVAAAHGLWQAARVIYDFVKRNETEVMITSSLGKWTIRPRDADPKGIAEILSKVAEVYRGHAGQ